MPVAMPDGTRRGRLWLWVAHRMAWVWLAMFAAVISQGVIASIAWGVVVDLAVWVALLVLIYLPLAADSWLFANHRRLTPWCPQCRWPDGGSPEVVPEPVPPSIRRTR